MALRMVEGFETFGTTVGNTIQDGLDRRYGNFHGLSLGNYVPSMQLATGRNGGYSAKSNASYQHFYYAIASDDLPTNDTWIVGLAVKFDICDTEGSTNNDFLGQVVIEAIFPSADGDSSDWTPASGTDNYAMVDDNPTDDDTSYIESNAEGDTDLYQYTDLSRITDHNILGVVLKTEPRMTAFPGDLDIYQTVNSGSTTSDGDTTNIATDSYTSIQRVLETDPNTSSAWTASGVGAAQFGVKVGT